MSLLSVKISNHYHCFHCVPGSSELNQPKFMTLENYLADLQLVLVAQGHQNGKRERQVGSKEGEVGCQQLLNILGQRAYLAGQELHGE